MNNELTKPVIKLFKKYAANPYYDNVFDDSIICCGIWETRAVFIEKGKRIYEFICAIPFNDKVKRGDTRKMYEQVIVAICEKVEITRSAIVEKVTN